MLIVVIIIIKVYSVAATGVADLLLQTDGLFCVLSCDGQLGAATRGDTGEAQGDKVCYCHRFLRGGRCMPCKTTGKEPGPVASDRYPQHHLSSLWGENMPSLSILLSEDVDFKQC